MVNSTWAYTPPTDDYTNGSNWTTGAPPTVNDTGFFGISDVTSIILTFGAQNVGGWFFSTNSSKYTFSITGGGFNFFGEGIILNGGSCNIDFNTNHFDIDLQFLNNSTAGSASITEEIGQMWFTDISTAGSANIVNKDLINFFNSSTAGNALIHTMSGGQTFFSGGSDGGNAQLNTDTGGTVDFSQSKGPMGDHKLTAGSIEGPGTYLLGGDQLTVGLKGVSTNVSGVIEDGGLGGGSLASLVIRAGSLTLSHAGNTYRGGTTLAGGTLDLAALGAAGTGDITFKGGAKHNVETLMIGNAALSGHVFGNEIDFFGKHDVIDLSGLHFQPGAFATFHHEQLKVRSDGVTDKLTLVSPHGTHFEAASDHHGGTDVFLFFT